MPTAPLTPWQPCANDPRTLREVFLATWEMSQLIPMAAPQPPQPRP